MDDRKYINAFLEAMIAEKNISYNTYQSYKVDLLGLCEFVADNKLMLLNLGLSNLKDYIKFLYQKEYKDNTISRKISAIKNLYKFLYRDGVINVDPTLYLDSPKLSRTLPKALSFNEITKLLNVSALDMSPHGRRINAIVNILYSSGIRISELVCLKLCEVKEALSDNSVEVCHVKIKGKANKERIALFNACAVDSIKKYMEVYKYFVENELKGSQWLFPGTKFDTHITRQRVGQLLKELGVNAGIDITRLSPHKLRHSFATHLLDNGSNIVFIQKMLGHSHLSTTQIYTHIANEKLKVVLQKFHPLNNDD